MRPTGNERRREMVNLINKGLAKLAEVGANLRRSSEKKSPPAPKDSPSKAAVEKPPEVEKEEE